MNLMRIGLTAMISMGIACAQEPVDPQPAKPLTYVHPSYHKVTPDVAKKMMEEGVVLIDVREPDEFAEGHVKGAVNVPMSVLKPGMKLTGTVRNVIDFGAFVDLGVHQDGLVHVSQISDKFIKHPSEVLKVGDIVRVKVLNVDTAKKRIALTMKGLH